MSSCCERANKLRTHILSISEIAQITGISGQSPNPKHWWQGWFNAFSVGYKNWGNWFEMPIRDMTDNINMVCKQQQRYLCKHIRRKPVAFFKNVSSLQHGGEFFNGIKKSVVILWFQNMTPKRFLNHVVRFWTTKSSGLKNMLEVLNSDLKVNKMQFLVLRFERSELAFNGVVLWTPISKIEQGINGAYFRPTTFLVQMCRKIWKQRRFDLWMVKLELSYLHFYMPDFIKIFPLQKWESGSNVQDKWWPKIAGKCPKK